MTVAQLIELLKEMPQDVEVYREDYEHGASMINEVIIDVDNDVLIK